MKAFITFLMPKRICRKHFLRGRCALMFFAFLLASRFALAQTTGCTESSATPVITSTSPCLQKREVTGTSTEAEGTVIKLYKNGTTQLVTAFVFTVNSRGGWSAVFEINFVTPGDLITATAMAEGKCESQQSNAVKFTNGARYFRDADGDGQGVSSNSLVVCADNPVPPQGWSGNAGDCNDGDPLEFSGQVWYPDNDKDGYGVASQVKSSCNRPAGFYARSELTGINDCNDNDNTVWQGVLIYMDQDGDGYDNGASFICYTTTPPDGPKTTRGRDCDDTNKDVWRTGTFYKDTDGDGYTLAMAEQLCYGDNPPTGYIATKSIEIDCDDNNAGKWQSATLYADNDNDSYSIGNGETVCYGASVPTGYTATKSVVDDCNDNNPAINVPYTWVLDNDQDDYYTGTPRVQCTSPGAGYVVKINHQAGDCNDNNPAINVPSTWVLDKDEDGYYTGTPKLQCASPGAGYIVKTNQQAGDCNDNDPSVNPGAAEVCGNGKNDNCNSATDEQPCYACRNATSFSTTSITCNSATLNWISIAHPEQWQVRYKTTATGSKWKDVVLSGNIRLANLTNLAANQNYHWHIRARCGKNWTDFSNTISFKTLKTCASSRDVNSGISANKPIGIVGAETSRVALTLYPNPSNGQFVVDLRIGDIGKNSSSKARFQLIDIGGRTVQTESVVINNNTLHKTIRVSPVFVNGIYMVRITTGAGKVYSQKLVLEKL